MPAKVSDQLQRFKTLKIGGGGYLTGHSQHKDGTLVCRTDTYGAYLWDEAKKTWTQLVTSKSLPRKDAKPLTGQGVYEIAIAPTDSSIFYMAYAGRIYRSADKGGTWERTSLPQIKRLDPNSPSIQRMTSRKMAIDPNDANHVLLGTMDDGLWRTKDAGKTWAQVKDIPMPKNIENNEDPGVAGIIFDPYRDGVVYAASHGHGFFKSTDNGATFKLLEGGPTLAPISADVAADGALYMVQSDGKAARRYDGKWLELNAPKLIEQGAFGVVCDPQDEQRVVFCTGGGSLLETRDRGENVSGIMWQAENFEPPEIPWFGDRKGVFLAVGALSFHPTEPETLMMSMGIGFLKGKIKRFSEGISADWQWMTNGIGQLVANQIIAAPNGNVCVASWDRAVFKITNPDKFPERYLASGGEEINHCAGIDWCGQDPNIIAAVNFQKGSGVSRDGMESFEAFETAPFSSFPDAGGGGEIAVGGPDNYVWVGTNRLGAAFTKDGGATWGKVELPGVGNDEEGMTGYNWAYYLKRHICAADRVKPGVFYLWHTAGIFSSSDGGETWKRVSNSPLDGAGFNAKMRSVPGVEGYLLATAGPLSGSITNGFARSINGGENWSAVDGVTGVIDFGLGAIAPGGKWPAVWVVGYVNEKFGIYRSDDNCESWLRVSDGFPLDSIDSIVAIDGDKQVHDRCYVGFGGSGYAYAPGGQKTDVKSDLKPVIIPGHILIPAAAMYRAGKRWSDVKAAHSAFEREFEAALSAAGVNTPGWRKLLDRLKAAWKNF